MKRKDFEMNNPAFVLIFAAAVMCFLSSMVCTIARRAPSSLLDINVGARRSKKVCMSQ
ncbi:MAG: hypothetical protein RSD19_04745 [Oscillospiraceae bacterium]